jgi:hypothetical protein
VLDAVASTNTVGFLWRGICVSLSKLDWLFGAKTAYLHLENYDLQEGFLSKTNSILTWTQGS